MQGGTPRSMPPRKTRTLHEEVGGEQVQLAQDLVGRLRSLESCARDHNLSVERHAVAPVVDSKHQDTCDVAQARLGYDLSGGEGIDIKTCCPSNQPPLREGKIR